MARCVNQTQRAANPTTHLTNNSVPTPKSCAPCATTKTPDLRRGNLDSAHSRVALGFAWTGSAAPATQMPVSIGQMPAGGVTADKFGEAGSRAASGSPGKMPEPGKGVQTG